MYAEAPRRLVLVGELDRKETESLTSYCRRLGASGQRELHLDLTGVTDCRASGLFGLLELLAEPTEPEVTIEGAHWGQFMLMLSQASVNEVQQLCDSVRTLLSAGPVRSNRVGKHAAPATSAAHIDSDGVLHDA